MELGFRIEVRSILRERGGKGGTGGVRKEYVNIYVCTLSMLCYVCMYVVCEWERRAKLDDD